MLETALALLEGHTFTSSGITDRRPPSSCRISIGAPTRFGPPAPAHFAARSREFPPAMCVRRGWSSCHVPCKPRQVNQSISMIPCSPSRTPIIDYPRSAIATCKPVKHHQTHQAGSRKSRKTCQQHPGVAAESEQHPEFAAASWPRPANSKLPVGIAAPGYASWKRCQHWTSLHGAFQVAARRHLSVAWRSATFPGNLRHDETIILWDP